MLKVDTDKGVIQLEAVGSLPVLMADLCAITNSIYNAIARQDKKLAAEFRNAYSMLIIGSHDLVWSNVRYLDSSIQLTLLPDVGGKKK